MLAVLVIELTARLTGRVRAAAASLLFLSLVPLKCLYILLLLLAVFVYMYIVYRVCSAHRRQRSAWDPLELETVVNQHVAGCWA